MQYAWLENAGVVDSRWGFALIHYAYKIIEMAIEELCFQIIVVRCVDTMHMLIIILDNDIRLLLITF